MFVRAQNAGPASGLGLPMREPSVVSCVPLAPRITCSLLTVIATKHFFDFGNREWLVATRERPSRLSALTKRRGLRNCQATNQSNLLRNSSEKPVLHGDEVKDRGTAQESSRTMKPAAVAALDNC